MEPKYFLDCLFILEEFQAIHQITTGMLLQVQAQMEQYMLMELIIKLEMYMTQVEVQIDSILSQLILMYQISILS